VGLLKGVRAEARRDLLAWQQLASERAGLAELLARVALRPGELEALLWSGALDELAGLRSSDYPWVHEALWGELSRGQLSSLEGVTAEARRRIPTDPPQLVARYSGLSRVQGELRYLEMHISAHPMRLLRAEADRLCCVRSEHLSRYVDRVVSFAGIVAATRNVGVAERGAVQFITLEDEYGLMEARLSPEAWKRFHSLLSTPGPYLLRGRVHQRHGAISFSILDFSPFHERATHLPVAAWGEATGFD
jgi:DNA polymerase III alpha subunit